MSHSVETLTLSNMFRLFIIIFTFAVINTSGKSIEKGPSQRMTLIGNYNGRSYFYDNMLFDYAGAKQNCISQEMELAEISSVALQQMLMNHEDLDPEFGLSYWVAARDAMTPVQFVWEKSGGAMATGLIWGGITGPYTCVNYFNKAFDADKCSAEFGSICQS